MKRSLSNARWALAPLLAVLVLAGCASAPTSPQAALPAIPAAYKESQGQWTVAQPAEAQARGEWWKAFSDPALDELVERAGHNNTSIAQSAARLAQARALLRSTDADRSLQVGVGAGVTRQGGGVAVASGTAGTLTNVRRESVLRTRPVRSSRQGDQRRRTRRELARGLAAKHAPSRSVGRGANILRPARARQRTFAGARHGCGLCRHAAPDREPLPCRRCGRTRRGTRAHRKSRQRNPMRSHWSVGAPNSSMRWRC